MTGATIDKAPEIALEVKGCVRGIVQELVDELCALPGAHVSDGLIEVFKLHVVVLFHITAMF